MKKVFLFCALALSTLSMKAQNAPSKSKEPKKNPTTTTTSSKEVSKDNPATKDTKTPKKVEPATENKKAVIVDNSEPQG